MAENSVDIEFGAKTAGLDSAVDKVKEGIKGIGEQVKEEFDPASAASVAFGMSLEKLGEQIAEFISEAVHEAIHAYAEWGEEIDHMQKRLGGTSESLSSLKVALDAVGISQSSYESVARRLPQILDQHEEQFKAAGVAYKDANGDLLPVTETIQNINEYLQKFSAGADRSAAGNQLMGRSFAMMADFVELSSERMKEADDVAKKFGLTMSKDDIEATNEFGAQLGFMHEAIHGFYVAIGEALTPALTELAVALKSALVPAFELLSPVLKAVGFAFDGIAMSVVLVVAVIVDICSSLELLIKLAGAAALALTGNFAKGAEMAKKAMEDYKKSIEETNDMVVRSADKLSAHMSRMINGKTEEPEEKGAKPPPTPDKTAAAAYALAKARAEAELAAQREYLKEAQSMYDAAYADGEISTKQYYAAKLAIEEAGIDASIAAKKKEIQESQGRVAKDENQRLQFAAEQAKLAGQLNVLEAQRIDLIRKNAIEYKNAENARTAAMQVTAAKQQQSLANAEIAAEAAAGQQRLALQQTTAAKEFELQKQLENRSLEATKEYLRQKMEAEMLTSKNKQQTMADYNAAVEEAELKHQQKLTDIDNAATKERMKYQLQAQNAVQSSMANMFEGLMKGTKSLSDAFKSFADDVIAQILRIKSEQMAAQIMGSGTSSGGTVGSGIGDIIGGLMQFAVGTNYVPNDMLAVVHKGERIIPAVQNNPAMLGAGASQNMTIHNNFTVAGSVDTRTQAQIATLAGIGIQRAMARNA